MWLDADSALRHLDRLHAAALALSGNRADAEDLVQETYLTLLRRPRRLRGTSELAYLMTMLRNRYIDDCRAAARRQSGPGLYEIDEPVDPRAGLRPDRVAEDREVLDAVHALDTPFRETVVAVDMLGLSYKEAAAALDVPVGTIMSRLARGRDRVVCALEAAPESGSLVACG
ncbi:MAG TPA: sigma-70 family RNA polymerase sigma factor [Solirubrobacteraceae bacterium]|nr:sigma-70 family RNA polymerase sigma factor [Solirubrobacteraceae bacterium]